ncbi:PREDICTED: nicotinamide N-methyltransferase-like [Nanorana parkeri]|uniref:nicotinamide N-methyltransferase-like n=1 Tax=Nanorana parkeri TaxID=125878 RepID=UPI000854675C|nr:PREDICTED: nicotinamide N-methyltransferase-like [Nanorana parkeri]
MQEDLSPQPQVAHSRLLQLRSSRRCLMYNMEVLSASEVHVYDKDFDGRKYLDMFYRVDPETDKESIFMLTFLKNIFSSGRVEGNSLIEIGAGPCIYHIISACENFKQIYLTDYVQGNLQEIEKWLKCDREAFDWSPVLKYVCDIENHRSTEEEKAEKIRRKVSLMKCDVTKANPLQPNSLPLADCVIVAGCLICVCNNAEDFKNALKNTVSLIRSGGYLVIVDYLGASYYLVGEAKFKLLSLDENIVREAVTESGCEIEEFTKCTDFQITEEVFDCKNVFCLLARKH